MLVQLRDLADPETGQRYTVKRYQSEKSRDEDAAWRHVKMTLLLLNPEFAPIEITADDEGEVCVVAELVEVLE